jgi:hypothetical protein
MLASLLFSEDRILDQARNHRGNLKPELVALPSAVRADHRVLETGLDVDRLLADLDCLSGKKPEPRPGLKVDRGSDQTVPTDAAGGHGSCQSGAGAAWIIKEGRSLFSSCIQ